MADERYPNTQVIVAGHETPATNQVRAEHDLLRELTDISTIIRNKDGVITQNGDIDESTRDAFGGILNGHIGKAVYSTAEQESMNWLMSLILERAVYNQEKTPTYEPSGFNRIIAGWGLAHSKLSLAKEGENNIIRQIKLAINENVSRNLEWIGTKKDDLDKLYSTIKKK